MYCPGIGRDIKSQIASYQIPDKAFKHWVGQPNYHEALVYDRTLLCSTDMPTRYIISMSNNIHGVQQLVLGDLATSPRTPCLKIYQQWYKLFRYMSRIVYSFSNNYIKVIGKCIIISGTHKHCVQQMVVS